MGRSSEDKQPRKDLAFKSAEPLQLVHTNISRPFVPKSIERGKSKKIVVIDDYSKKSWTWI